MKRIVQNETQLLIARRCWRTLLVTFRGRWLSLQYLIGQDSIRPICLPDFRPVVGVCRRPLYGRLRSRTYLAANGPDRSSPGGFARQVIDDNPVSLLGRREHGLPWSTDDSGSETGLGWRASHRSAHDLPGGGGSANGGVGFVAELTAFGLEPAFSYATLGPVVRLPEHSVAF